MNKNKNKNKNENGNLTGQNLMNVYNVNLNKMGKPEIGNTNANKRTRKINWGELLPPVEGQRAAANPTRSPGKIFGRLFSRGGSRKRKTRRRQK